MGKLLSYSGTTTKIRAIKSRLPDPEGLRDAGCHADGHRRAGLSETEALL